MYIILLAKIKYPSSISTVSKKNQNQKWTEVEFADIPGTPNQVWVDFQLYTENIREDKNEN